MTCLSILIPCLSDQHALERTLLSVLPACSSEVEVVVIDRTRYTDPYQLDGKELELLSVDSSAGLSQMLNLGMRHSRAPFVHVLGCGLEVEVDWYRSAMAELYGPSVGSVAVACKTTAGDDSYDQTATFGVGQSRLGRRVDVVGSIDKQVSGRVRRSIVGPAWYAAFYRRDVLEMVEAFDGTAVDGLLDLETATRIMEAGYETIVDERSRIALGARREPIIRSSFQLGRRERCVLRRRRHAADDRNGPPVASSVIREIARPQHWIQLAGHVFEWLRPSESADAPTALSELRDTTATQTERNPSHRLDAGRPNPSHAHRRAA